MIYDVLIIGGGPAGTYAGFYCGIRSLKTIILERSSIIGGQPISFFESKNVYDFPGKTKITGSQLTKDMIDQLNTVKDYVEYITDAIISEVKEQEDYIHVVSNIANFKCKRLILATGGGIFKPIEIESNKLSGDNKILYHVKNEQDFVGKNLVILGGGDSAVDWANHFSELNICNSVSIVHRRKEWRCKQSSYVKMHSNRVNVFEDFEVISINNGVIEIKSNSDSSIKNLNCDLTLVQYGFKGELIKIKGLENLRRNNFKFEVNTRQQTNNEKIYAIGSSCWYEGKTNVIAVSLGEAVNAVTSISSLISPTHQEIFYSTNKKED